MKVEGAKPFPHWNEAYKYEIPKEIMLILAYSNGLTGQEVIDHERKTYGVTHWMYAPTPPESEPKRGVWVNVEDGLPPLGIRILVKMHSTSPGVWDKAERQNNGSYWVYGMDTAYRVKADEVIAWYLPHECY